MFRLYLGVRMFRFFSISIVALFYLSTSAFADTPPPTDTRVVPQHSFICIEKKVNNKSIYIVDREKLALHLIGRHPMSPQLSAEEFKPASNSNYGPERWRRFIIDPEFCSQNVCLKSDVNAIVSINSDFAAFVSQGIHAGEYSTHTPKMGLSEYFSQNNANLTITCTAINPPAPIPTASSIPDISLWRVRGIADDLYLDRGSAGFSTTSKATLTETGDSSATHTQSTKIQGVVGYAVDIGSTDRIFRTAVPYLAANESLAMTQGKPNTNAPYNFIAAGMLLTEDIEGRHFFSLRPQYQENTTQRAQLTSLRAIYAPWTRAEESKPFLPFNTPVPLNQNDQFQPVITGQLLFDLRADVGTYGRRGDPPYNSQNQTFERFGTKSGLAFSATPSNLPTFTLTATETILYGASGSLRNLNLFETALTISLDPHNYYGLTFGYANGFNEDTAVRLQSWTIGFSAHL